MKKERFSLYHEKCLIQNYACAKVSLDVINWDSSVDTLPYAAFIHSTVALTWLAAKHSIELDKIWRRTKNSKNTDHFS